MTAPSLRIKVAAPRTALVKKAVEILGREIEARSGVKAAERGKGKPGVILDIRPGIGREGFRIVGGSDGGVAITGNDGRGLLYGVGKFLRTSRFDEGRFTPGAWRGTSVPERPVRGIYFASHFHNFYHDAPVEKVERYVEELALWGCNALAVWFDMHHFTGIGDPAAQAMIERLRAIIKAANGVGIGAALTTLSNEGYANSPEALRADWTAGHDGYTTEPGGHYHVEICPSKPGGLDLILRWREEMLEAFADLKVDYVWIWPYDQGGCTCAQCAPWGANGFLRNAEGVGRLVRRKLPAAKTVLSTWYFDHFTKGEWEGMDQAFRQQKPEWVDYVMADDYGDTFPEYPLVHGVPGGFPMLNFPEISMYRMGPWGGYGANPLPRHLQALWDAAGAKLAGGFPYSEGIFEDINKAVNLQHYWGGRDAMETVREYAAFEFSPHVTHEVAAAVEGMEKEHEHGTTTEGGGNELKGRLFPPDGSTPAAIYRAPRLKTAAARAAALDAAEARMTARAKDAWRWRILRLRAGIDAEIERSGGVPGEALDGMFDELCRIYHADGALGCVAPPSRRALVRLSAAAPLPQ